MSKDITTILAGWDHDPDDLQVRIVAGDDGRDKLQMRIELGLLQMELNGRPDGETPHGFESFLDYHEAMAAAAGDDYPLESAMCADLMREGVQYYHRYLALFHLERYDLVARDTSRNLRLFAFVRDHAVRSRDKLQFDRFRPYVTMMRARALGLAALEQGRSSDTLDYINEGIKNIRAFLREYDQMEEEPKCSELNFLRTWRKQVERERKVDPIERLQEQLSLAVSKEDFEEAARIRDQIRRLSDPLAT